MDILRKLSVILIIVMTHMVSHADRTGEDIMKRCADKFKNHPSIEIEFSIAGNGRSDNGRLVMSKDLFYITTPELSIWFDGKTQWTYVASSNEVNITEPTGEELMESNPFELINSYYTHFTSNALQSPASSDIVMLTPKTSDQSLLSAKITISRSTGWPTAIVMTFENGASTSVAITKVTPGKALPAETFRYNAQYHPGAEIIDLR